MSLVNNGFDSYGNQQWQSRTGNVHSQGAAHCLCLFLCLFLFFFYSLFLFLFFFLFLFLCLIFQLLGVA